MKKAKILPIAVRLSAVCAPEGDLSIIQHSTHYRVDLPDDQSSVEQLRSLRKLQRAALRALANVLARFPVKGECPAVHLLAYAGYQDCPLAEFGFALEYDREQGGYGALWPLRDGNHGVARAFCPTLGAAVRRVRSILKTLTNEWLLTCPRVNLPDPLATPAVNSKKL